MQHSISLKKRLLTLLIAAGFLLGSVFAAGSETSAATSRLKVSPTKKTIYVGKATTLKANKKVRWSVYKGKKYVKIVETDLDKAEFGDGVMVLPVSYTKGLEFDAVLLFDPTQEKYPSDNGHVKLLYVAATRALHELVVLHRGKLTGILADKVPEGKHMKEFAAETSTKAAEFAIFPVGLMINKAPIKATTTATP